MITTNELADFYDSIEVLDSLIWKVKSQIREIQQSAKRMGWPSGIIVHQTDGADFRLMRSDGVWFDYEITPEGIFTDGDKVDTRSFFEHMYDVISDDEAAEIFGEFLDELN